jgi:hypothetical protein
MQYTFDWKHSKNTPKDLRCGQVGLSRQRLVAVTCEWTYDGGLMQNSTRKPSVMSAGGSCVSAERLRDMVSDKQWGEWGSLGRRWGRGEEKTVR